MFASSPLPFSIEGRYVWERRCDGSAEEDHDDEGFGWQKKTGSTKTELNGNDSNLISDIILRVSILYVRPWMDSVEAGSSEAKKEH